MNAPFVPPASRTDRLIAEANEILDRTSRIVRRVMPDVPTPHGFYDPQGFVAASRFTGQRNELFRQVQKRITDKVRARPGSPFSKMGVR